MTILPSLIPFLATTMANPTGLFGMPEQASTIAPEIDFVYELITWICIFFFVLIVGIMVVFMVKYTKPRGTPAEGTVTHHTMLEVVWTTIPLILVVVIFFVGMRGYLHMRVAPQGAFEVYVTAQKWNWQFNYPNGATTTELIVPKGRPVKLIMSSQDVLHSLFIPAFRVKQDVVPGRYTTLWFEAVSVSDEDGYDLYCAEYCGTRHSTMLSKVIVLEEDEFEQRIADEAEYIDKIPADRLYVAGPRLYARCKSCHSLDGTNLTGPSWKGLWERTQNGETVFTDGTTLKDLMGEGKMFTNAHDYISQSIVDPQQKVVMNYSGAMPTFKGMLGPQEMQAIFDFMKNLDKFDEKGNPLDEADSLKAVLDAAKAADE